MGVGSSDESVSWSLLEEGVQSGSQWFDNLLDIVDDGGSDLLLDHTGKELGDDFVEDVVSGISDGDLQLGDVAQDS